MDILTMIVNGIKNLFFGEQSASEKAANLATFVISIFVLIFALESAMGLITIGRLERQINLLKELSSLSSSEVGDSEYTEKLNVIFKDAVDSLDAYEPVDIYVPILQIVEDNRETIGDILPGAAAWIFLAVLVPFLYKDKLWLVATITSIVAVTGLAVGWIVSQFIHTGDPNWTILIRFIIGVVSLVVIGSMLNKRSSTQQSDRRPEVAEGSE